MKKSSQLATSFVVAASMMFAQQQPINNKCHTDVATKYYFDTHPGAKEQYEKNMKEAHFAPEHLNELARNGNNSVNANGHDSYALDSIPIVFHILHLGGSENVPNSVIYTALAEINRVHGSKTSDSANIDPYFASVYGSNHFVFKLATKDPSGNCTNGIIRHYDPNTNWDETQYSNYAYTWNSTQYLNIYVVKTICNGACPSASGAEGYSYLPGTFAAGSSMDAIVFIYSGLSSDPRGVAHEMGHWFGLEHTFGSTNTPGTCMSGGNSDDFLSSNPPSVATTGVVDDTPKDAGSMSCVPQTPNSCDVSNYVNGQNIMCYGNCPLNFTDGQIHRMHNIMFSTTANRSNIISSANKIATGIRYPQPCIPIPYFHASSTLVCSGSTVTFSDSTDNTIVTSWSWNFPGGTLVSGYTLTDSMPKVIYNTPGTYGVSYTASNSTGSANIVKMSYIHVVSSTAAYNTNFTEGFEVDSVPGFNWSVSSTAASNWMVTSTAAAAGGVKSVMINNMTNPAGDTSILVSPSFNLAAIGSPALTFAMSYQQQTTTNSDKLQVYVSTDCGATWVSKWARSGSTLQPSVVSGQSTTAFVPTPTQFATYTISLSSISSVTNAIFRWVFYAGTSSVGNNIYLDNINVYNTTTGIQS
ncbi:MAG: M43 family zinc metalloprotease, partial [Bacteroidia bacterium]